MATKFEREITDSFKVTENTPYVDYETFEKILKGTLEFRIPVDLLVMAGSEMSELEVYTIVGKAVLEKIKHGS